MKLTIDPLPMAKASRKTKVNAAFNITATPHLDAAYAQKRLWAEHDVSKLETEAQMRGMTAEALAEVILSKPDTIAERELQRQRIMKRIDEATSLQELENVSGE